MSTNPTFRAVADARPGDGYVLRGDNRALISAREHEVVLSGPAETGKSMVCCIKLHLIAMRYPGAQLSMVRKTAASVAGSVALTFQKVVAGTKGAPRVHGGATPTRFLYDNGACIWIGGLDRPEKILSTERDCIYVCQAEELTENDWEMLLTRCTGRGAVVRWPQLFGDCNPGGSRHWIKKREKEGKLRLLVSRITDNPSLYDETGREIDSDSVRRRLAVRDNYTGIRKLRLKDGIWATAEGAVYADFDSSPGRHVQRRNYSEMKRMFLTVDEGYTNPAVTLEVGEDGDGRWHVFREFHKRNCLPADHVAETVRWWRFPVDNARAIAGTPDERPPFEVCAVDESAAGMIAELRAKGVNAVGGKGRVLDGIQRIRDRLQFKGDGRPRITFDPSCVETINELESYVLKKDSDDPVKEHDHASDSLRYLGDVLGEPTGALKPGDVVHVGPNAVAGAVTAQPTAAGRHWRDELSAQAAGGRHFVPRRLG